MAGSKRSKRENGREKEEKKGTRERKEKFRSRETAATRFRRVGQGQEGGGCMDEGARQS